MPTRTVADSALTLTLFAQPEHANSLGTVHGGVVLKLCDECAGIIAARHSRRPCVTVTVDSVTFHQPVPLAHLIFAHGRITYVGTTSMEIQVRVEVENLLTGQVTHTNDAYFVYVALDEKRRPTPVPRLDLQSDDERRRFDEGRSRQGARLARAQSGT